MEILIRSLDYLNLVYLATLFYIEILSVNLINEYI